MCSLMMGGAGGDEQSPEIKKSSKVQEIAEQIHFDPNTMLPGAQHPSLNYNATESSRRADEWRNFAQSQSGYGGMDDDDELPPPVSGPCLAAAFQTLGAKAAAHSNHL